MSRTNGLAPVIYHEPDRKNASGLARLRRGWDSMSDNFDLSKGVVPIVLVIGMLGAVGAGSWWASGISRDIQELSAKLQPLTEVGQEVGENSREIDALRDELRRLERGHALNESRIRTLQIELGVKERMEEMERKSP